MNSCLISCFWSDHTFSHSLGSMTLVVHSWLNQIFEVENQRWNWEIVLKGIDWKRDENEGYLEIQGTECCKWFKVNDRGKERIDLTEERFLWYYYAGPRLKSEVAINKYNNGGFAFRIDDSMEHGQIICCERSQSTIIWNALIDEMSFAW